MREMGVAPRLTMYVKPRSQQYWQNFFGVIGGFCGYSPAGNATREILRTVYRIFCFVRKAAAILRVAFDIGS